MRLKILIDDSEDVDSMITFLQRARNLSIEVDVPLPDLEPTRAAIGEPKIIFMDEGQMISYFIHAPMEIVEPSADE